MKNRPLPLALALLLVAGACITVPPSRTARAAGSTPALELWREVDEASIARKQDDDRVRPQAYRVFQLDEVALGNLLDRAPLEFSETAKVAAARPVMTIPMPDGSLQRFRIQESPVMEPELAARFPAIRTFVAQGIDDPAATVRLDHTPLGFHAQILSPNGSVYVEPHRKGDTSIYTTYFKRDLLRDPGFACLVAGDDAEASAERAAAPETVGQTLRTYRLALANTIEYATAVCSHNGVPVTVDNVLAAMATTVNRVTGIYERDLAVRMVLIANNSAIVNTTSDTYTNNDGFAMLSQNQTRINSVIGAANYDIGHVLSTGGGGVAGLGVVCVDSQKARGVTGLPTPYGDAFDVDYVAHEMGHQFGGNHTFNSTTSSCGGGNRNSLTAYEPGSGSTIQAYAGICGSANLQPNSDAYFHGISYDEMVSFTNSGSGNSCAVQTATGNLEPTVDAGPAYTIPANTPFELTAASASDPNGDALTYCWEQFNLGPSLNTNTDNGSSPIFRSFNPSTSPTRVFPKIPDLVNNTVTFGEVLPTTSRTMTFRLTVRDNRAGGGGVAFDSTTVTTTTTAGPFQVTAPNTATTFAGGSAQNVTWNVASTNTGSVNTPNVSILLSLDGGLTFPIVLRAVTPNDGSESITIPNVASTQARIKVKGAGNVFFDISNANFTITSGVTGGDSAGIYSASTGTYFLKNSNAVEVEQQAAQAGEARGGGRHVGILPEGADGHGAHRPPGTVHTRRTVEDRGARGNPARPGDGPVRDPRQRPSATRFAITTAASAASQPALPLSPPERASACARSSVVSRPKATGTPVSRPIRIRPWEAAAQM